MPKRPAKVQAGVLASPDDIEHHFYEALQSGDLDRLMSIWADDEEVVCIHPGGPRLVGPNAIRLGFEAIFANGHIPVHPERVLRVQQAGCAVHSVVERIDINTNEGPKTAWVMATNVYAQTTQGWRLVSHHASPGTAEPPAEVSDAPANVLH